MFIGLLSVRTQVLFSRTLLPKEPTKYLTLNNRPCQATPTFFNISSDETISSPFSGTVNKCGGSCNTIDNTLAFEFVCQIK